jgi:hypothetical protein
MVYLLPCFTARFALVTEFAELVILFLLSAETPESKKSATLRVF